MRLRLRARARSDLEGILEYSVGRHGEEGEAYLRDINKALERLGEHPELGSSQPDLGKDLRSFPVREHRIFYLIYPDRVSVLRVLHKAMDVERHL